MEDDFDEDAEYRRELVEAAVAAILPNATNETHAWNIWNNLNGSPEFITAFKYFHPDKD